MTAIDFLISAAILAAVIGLGALLFLASIWGRPGSPAQDAKNPFPAVPSAFDAVHPTDANSATQIAEAAVKVAQLKAKP